MITLGDIGRMSPDVIADKLPGIFRLPLIIIMVVGWGLAVAIAWLLLPKKLFEKFTK